MKIRNWILAFGTVTALVTADADVLELKNGAVMSGRYEGGTAGTIRFTTKAGMQVIPTTDALALTFTGEPTPTAAEAPAPAQTAAPKPPEPAAATAAPKPAVVTVPAGTTVLIRLGQPLSTNSVRTGDRFSCRLDADVVVGGVVVAPKNTPAYGTVIHAEQAKRVRGQSKLEIALTELSINGELQAIKTAPWSSAGEKAAAAMVKGAAAGAAIGGLADGSDGAGTGALIGATAGALKKGDAVVIPQNQLMEFKVAVASEVKVSG